MNYQTRAFQISFLLHMVIIALAIIGSSFLGQYKKVMVLDFVLLKPVPEVKKVEASAPTPFIKTRQINPGIRSIIKKEEPPPMPEKVSRMLSVSETQPIVKLPETHNPENRSMGLEISDQVKAEKEGSHGIVGGTKDGSGMGNADDGKTLAKTKYLNDHFAYIRDKILGNVNYPDAARRMGWQGKVLLSFIITAEGSVRAFRVIKSSGFTILDKSAIETVRDAAPFPHPPGEAQLVIPIIYCLE